MDRYDPRATRPNPMLRDILGVIRASWRDFDAAKPHGEKRGHAMVLAAALEQFLDEPGTLPADLQAGAVDDARCRIPLADLGEAASSFLSAYPFDPVDAPGPLGFMMTYQHRLTPLYAGPARDPMEVRFFGGFSMSQALERRHLTPAPTTAHALNAEPFRWLARRQGLSPRLWLAGPEAREVHLVLADPRGYAGPLDGDPLLVGMTDDLAAAIAAADLAAAELGIRMLVATPRITFDNH